ncbi:MAG: carboxypeptidase regulatory-like domain-containing protein [Acidobacteriota bacterium]|nr:carboxypeptidase regulatory-like domain-containing protein [Acidobacteriota bacterium]
MFRRYFFPVLAFAVVMVSASLFVSAQTGMLRGHVNLKQPDGTKVPLVNAVIDVYRVDVAGKYNTKTDKKGEFVFAGLPYVGTYVVAVSQPTVRPDWLPNVKAGREVDYALEVTPGDGRRLTYEEIKTQMAGSKGPATGEVKESSSDKAKREELEKKNAEILAKNEKVKNSNEIVSRAFTTGNAALLAKNFDEAIKQYEEGLAADPAQPALLINESRAYTGRGVARYNAAVTQTDDAARTSGIESAKSDFRAGATSSAKAVELIKGLTPPTEADALTRFNNNKLAAATVNAEAMRLFVSKGDPSQADAGLAAFKDYIALETDPVKKGKAQLDVGQMLLDAGAVDKAFIEYKSILATEPDNPDANLGAGLSLYASGDKAKYQDAANYLQHFVDVAPDTHKFKADTKAILAELKNTEKVVPEKTPVRTRRRP